MRLLAQAACLVHFNLLTQSMEVSIVDIGQIRPKYLGSAKGLAVSQSDSLLVLLYVCLTFVGFSRCLEVAGLSAAKINDLLARLHAVNVG